MINLFTQTVRPKWSGFIASGNDVKEAMFQIFEEMGCAFGSINEAEGGPDEYSMEYEIDRNDLKNVRDYIATQFTDDEEHMEYIDRKLRNAELTREQFIGILDSLLTQSDQSDDWVYLAWW